MSAEDYAGMHRKAFRAAFDWLNGHFPPEDDADWWCGALADLTRAGDEAEAERNPLTTQLLAGVWEYLYQENERRKAG